MSRRKRGLLRNALQNASIEVDGGKLRVRFPAGAPHRQNPRPSAAKKLPVRAWRAAWLECRSHHCPAPAGPTLSSLLPRKRPLAASSIITPNCIGPLRLQKIFYFVMDIPRRRVRLREAFHGGCKNFISLSLQRRFHAPES